MVRHSSPSVPSPADRPDGIEQLRDMTRRGSLAEWMMLALPAEQRRIRQALYQVAWPVVFDTATRATELRRGHGACARGLRGLAPECLDRFHDDVAAVVDGAIRRGATEVQHLEGWLAAMTKAAIVDGHRRRRGERGALQRPRVPQWLARELRDDCWLVDLAVSVLVWVGLSDTVGAELWPLHSWADRRAELTGKGTESTPERVRSEVDHVLDRMRAHPRWFEAHVQRPLSLKQVSAPPSDLVAHSAAILAGQEDREASRLTALAGTALGLLQSRLDADEDPRTVVPTVLRTVFCGDHAGQSFDRVLDTLAQTGEWLSDQLSNEVTASRITAAVLDAVEDSTAALHLKAG